MKVLTRKVFKKVGKIYKHLQEIKCTVCGARTYADGHKHTENFLSRSCELCSTLATAKRRGISNTIFQRERRKEINKRLNDGATKRTSFHGLSTTKSYSVWINMMSRCYDTYLECYPDYGGRGITVCDEWHDFSVFFLHMGERPHDMELDRIDNDYIYCPENCRWVVHDENVSNRRAVFKRGAERHNIGWWVHLGCLSNPYVYGPMPWKRTALKWRVIEAIQRGWHVPGKYKSANVSG